MCGRYTLKAPREAIAEAFDLADAPQLLPRYNIAPTQAVPASCGSTGRAASGGLSLLQWGLIPSWADDPAIGNRLINARAETVAEKPAFRTAFQKCRCLVVADGFYEFMWTRWTGGCRHGCAAVPGVKRPDPEADRAAAQHRAV